ncbi:hypothetical protein QNI16_20875 [Cytophagaceae bacterium YF14B1]|uniref:Uncharacterized protein n=1 Tax=Xanthocytophaga flava TaxID=3048013 RepID=A0AAE3U7I3_9BACT|nr:hypothetical protein [Xanthocytophaga flavus]MDJ1482969.1 hypothetical protein [Xanthocytophaga flavus]
MYKNRFLNLFVILILGFLGNLPLWAQDVSPAYQAIPMTAFEQKVYSLVDEVKNGRMTSNLSDSDLLDLPVGIAREINGVTYIIAIDSAYRAENGGQFLSAYAALEMPGSGGERKRIAFAGKNIAFGKGGLSATNSTRLVLASPQSFDVSETVKLILPADGRNYIEFDCSGFKSINMKGNFVFDPELLTPDKEIAKNATTVTASLEINAGDLNNMLVATSISPFQVKGLNGVTFAVTNAVVDMSDLVNPSGFIFPSDYQQAYGPDIQLWRGFYLQELNVTLPQELGSGTKRTTIQARNMLIDDMGVSGLFSAYNILALQQGSAGGWPFSIDRISVELRMNQLTGGGFSGAMNVPFLGEDTLGYTADMRQEKGELEYRFLVTTNAEREFKIPFSGTVRLDEGCTIGIEKKDGKLAANALLHGKMTLNHSLVSIKNIAFQNLGLTTKKPYLVSGQFSLSGDGQGAMANFPIQIDSINLGIYQGSFSIGIPLSLNLMNSEDAPPAASTYLRIMAKAQEEGEGDAKRQRWKLEKVKVEAVKIAFEKGSFGMNGLLEIFDNDPVYGNGFHGAITFTVGDVLGKGIKANAYFGSKDSYRYWHVDMYAPVKIALMPPLYLDGIMGGASYRMVRQGASVAYTPDFSKINSDSAPKTETDVKAGGSGAMGGKSGLVYKPDGTAGMGFLAGVTFVVAQEKAVNGDAMLEVMFNQGGGLKYIQFDGAAYAMAGFEGRARGKSMSTQAPIAAAVRMLYDNDNKVFHANMTAYINAAGAITGSAGPNGMAGEAVIHIDKKDWYVYIGRPTRMFGVQVLGLASAKTYFMIGSKIEDLPLPPSEVQEVFDNIDLNFMRDENAASTGRGFAFGAHLQVGYDSKDKLVPFFVTLKLGAGADVMIRDYGNTSCRGRSGKIGIDGWYASGQAYVFLKGAVGLRVKKKRFDIVSLGAAALLQAKLPNPAFMRGGLAGKYSVLGGLVKGKFNLMFTVGEECDMIQQGNELGDIETIASLKPDAGGNDISVFTAPQVSFNISIDKELPMANVNDELNVYRVRMDELKLYQNNQQLVGTIEWNESNDLATIHTTDVLPEKSSMKMTVKVHWEKKLAGGSWDALKDENGQIDYEIKETTFVTGEEPDNIPEENVVYSYPIRHQYHFHKGESTEGYVKLRQHQPKALRTKDEVATYSLIARFETKAGVRKEVPVSYNQAQTQIAFAIPQDLGAETVYQFTFVRIPQAQGAESNVARTEKEITRENAKSADDEFTKKTGGDMPLVSGGSTVSFTENDLTASVAQDIEKAFYESDFRTSRYATFGEKWDNFRNANDVALPSQQNQMVIGKAGVLNETFDQFELYGKDTLQPLVRAVASLNTTWLKDLMYPLLYQHYAANAAAGVSLSRNPSESGGIPPLQTPVVKLHNDGRSTGYMLTDNDWKAGFAPAQTGGVTLFYFLDTFVFRDFIELSNKAVFNTSSIESIQWLRNPASFYKTKGYESNGYINLLSHKKYPVVIRYTLPGTGKVTTEREIQINY